MSTDQPRDMQNHYWGPEVEKESFKYYPERSPDGFYNPSIFTKIFFGTDPSIAINKCERHIISAIETDPRIKLMLSALKSAGCPVDFRRHFCCERCHGWVNGGYDSRFNQIVICYNNVSKNTVKNVLGHELLHMYDLCRAKLDWDNTEHVACTEIRAANLFHCSVLSGFFSGSVNPLNIKAAHAYCVKQKAVASVLAVRPNMTKKEAWAVTEKVFDKCYNDLEPIGRRPRQGSTEDYRAYRERFLYGYF